MLTKAPTGGPTTPVLLSRLGAPAVNCRDVRLTKGRSVARLIFWFALKLYQAMKTAKIETRTEAAGAMKVLQCGREDLLGEGGIQIPEDVNGTD